jgi:hypothetical protein
MKSPSQLPLAGFLNPSDRLPAFLVPVFGDGGERWVQDSEGDGRLLQFSPLTSLAEKVIPARNFRLSAKIGDLLIYAFQFPNAEIDVGSKSEMQVVLSKRLEELRPFPFLMIDVLEFLGTRMRCHQRFSLQKRGLRRQTLRSLISGQPS